MKALVVIRHSKAEQDGPTDLERELKERGHRDAHAAGEWLAGTGFTPDGALVSDAVRARQTWEAVADGAGWSIDPDLEHGLYTADPDSALDLIAALPEESERVVVIGHNPTMGSLAQLLDDGSGDPDATTELMTGFPTSAVAVYEYDGSWADLAPATARLTAYHVGRG